MSTPVTSLLLAAAIFSAVTPATSQVPASGSPRVAVVLTSEPETSMALRQAFLRGMRSLGHVDGENISISFHYARNDPTRLPAILKSVVASAVNAIVVTTSPGALAARKATQSIPIVMVSVADPIGSGIVASLSRPGGNVTGLSNFNFELQGKRLELLREAVPAARRVALLYNPDNPVHARFIGEFETATRALSMDSMILAARNRTEIDAALSKARSGAIEVLIVADDGAFFGLRQHIAERGAHERLPLICGFAAMARAGCLFSYGNDLQSDLERAASYVDKILKGAQPAELPIEQPSKLELVINLRTAKALRLTIAPKLIARADEVIE